MIWLHQRRPAAFPLVRTTLVIASGLALVGYLAYPTAPPRFMPEWGFSDSVAQFTGLTSQNSSADALYNPFAAIPSMHVAFALMLGVPMAVMSRRWIAKVAWSVYPALVTFVVVATANHWWFDAFTGALVAAVAAVAALLFARWRPAAWAWPQPAVAGASHASL